MGFILFAEVFERGEDRIRRGLAEAAERSFLDLQRGSHPRQEAGLMFGEEDRDGVRTDLFLARRVEHAVVRAAVEENKLGLRVLVLRNENC